MNRLPTADPYLPGHGDPSYAVRHYDLELTYAVEGNRLDGQATLRVETLAETRRLVLDLVGLTVGKVRVSGAELGRHAVRGGRLVLDLKRVLPAGTELTLTIRYSGRPRPLVMRHLGDAGWEELDDGVIVAAQPHGSPTWFPCNDRPDDKAPYRIAVTATAGYRVIANGTLVEHRRRGSTETWVFDQPEPMATYLATVQIGRYVECELPEADGAALEVFGPADLPREQLRAAFGRQHEMLAFFSERFGPYPFGRYTVVVTADDLEIPLESQGLSTFGRNLVRGEWDAVRLVAHELAHQWFGNAVTLRRWQDIWLHEGFACYAEWLWSEESGDRTVEERARHHHGRLGRLGDELVLADPGPELMFDDRVYKRGALALHALRLAVGDEPFFALLREWVAEHLGGSVTTEEFLEFATERTGAEVGALLSPWLHRGELPAYPG